MKKHFSSTNYRPGVELLFNEKHELNFTVQNHVCYLRISRIHICRKAELCSNKNSLTPPLGKEISTETRMTVESPRGQTLTTEAEIRLCSHVTAVSTQSN